MKALEFLQFRCHVSGITWVHPPIQDDSHHLECHICHLECLLGLGVDPRHDLEIARIAREQQNVLRLTTEGPSNIDSKAWDQQKNPSFAVEF